MATRASKPAVIAALVFVAVSVTVVAVGRGERSGWILMTAPTGADNYANPMLGYSYLYGAEPYMRESISGVAQIGLYSGCLRAVYDAEDLGAFRFVRALYGGLATLLAPGLGAIGAMLAVNWLAWALSAWAAWALAWELFRDRAAALVASALATLGIGAIAHIGDYGPHLLSFGLYYLGVYLLLRSRSFERRLDLRRHLELGVFLGLACLAYTTGIALVAGYLLLSWRTNRLVHLAAGAACAVLPQAVLRALVATRVGPVEGEYLGRSLDHWLGRLAEAPGLAVVDAVRWTSELLFTDSPPVVVLGLVAMILVPLSRRERLAGALLWLLPYASALVFAPSAAARGYLVYGSSIWLYVCLAGWLGRLLKRPGTVPRGLAIAVLALVLAGHAAWSTAHLWHRLGPVKTYFLGWDDGLPYFMGPATEASSWTGHEPTPVLFGGAASLADAGAFAAPNSRSYDRAGVSFPIALVARSWLFVAVGLLVALAVRRSRLRRALLLAVALALPASAGLSWLTLRSLPAFYPVDRAVPVRPGDGLRYSVTLSPRLAGAVARSIGSEDRLAIFVHRATPSFEARLIVAGRRLPLDYNADLSAFEPVDGAAAAFAALAGADALTLELDYRGEAETRLGGWQRRGLPGRALEWTPRGGEGPPEPPVLPTVELRLVRPDGRLRLVGF